VVGSGGWRGGVEWRVREWRVMSCRDKDRESLLGPPRGRESLLGTPRGLGGDIMEYK
jgi:hypothetical protein